MYFFHQLIASLRSSIDIDSFLTHWSCVLIYTEVSSESEKLCFTRSNSSENVSLVTRIFYMKSLVSINHRHYIYSTVFNTRSPRFFFTFYLAKGYFGVWPTSNVINTFTFCSIDKGPFESFLNRTHNNSSSRGIKNRLMYIIWFECCRGFFSNIYNIHGETVYKDSVFHLS